MSELLKTRLKFHWSNCLEIWEKILYRFRLYKSVPRFRFYEAKQMAGQWMLESKQVLCDLQTFQHKILTKNSLPQNTCKKCKAYAHMHKIKL